MINLSIMTKKTKSKNPTRLQTFQNYFLIFFSCSVIGWLYEVGLSYVKNIPFENRGFLFGPYLPVYGFGFVLIVLVLQKIAPKPITVAKIPVRPLIVLVTIVVLAATVELITGIIFDKIFNLRLWGYRGTPWNYNGYIQFEAARNFGIGGLFLYYVVYQGLESCLAKISNRTRSVLFYTLGSIMVVDLIQRIVQMVVA